MGLTLELPIDLATDLAVEAARQGLTLADYALQVLALPRSPVPSIQCGKDLVTYWQAEGVVGSRTDIGNSQDYARGLREEAQRRG